MLPSIGCLYTSAKLVKNFDIGFCWFELSNSRFGSSDVSSDAVIGNPCKNFPLSGSRTRLKVRAPTDIPIAPIAKYKSRQPYADINTIEKDDKA